MRALTWLVLIVMSLGTACGDDATTDSPGTGGDASADSLSADAVSQDTTSREDIRDTAVEDVGADTGDVAVDLSAVDLSAVDLADASSEDASDLAVEDSSAEDLVADTSPDDASDMVYDAERDDGGPDEPEMEPLPPDVDIASIEVLYYEIGSSACEGENPDRIALRITGTTVNTGPITEVQLGDSILMLEESASGPTLDHIVHVCAADVATMLEETGISHTLSISDGTTESGQLQVTFPPIFRVLIGSNSPDVATFTETFRGALFTSVDFVNLAMEDPPTLEALRDYDCVYVLRRTSGALGVVGETFGDNLASYANNDGVVVVGPGIPGDLAGNIDTEGYIPVTGAGTAWDGTSQAVYQGDGTQWLFEGVSEFRSPVVQLLLQTRGSAVSDGTVHWPYAPGYTELAAAYRPDRQVVFINALPSSIYGDSDGDWVRLLANACGVELPVVAHVVVGGEPAVGVPVQVTDSNGNFIHTQLTNADGVAYLHYFPDGGTATAPVDSTRSGARGSVVLTTLVGLSPGDSIHLGRRFGAGEAGTVALTTPTAPPDSELLVVGCGPTTNYSMSESFSHPIALDCLKGESTVDMLLYADSESGHTHYSYLNDVGMSGTPPDMVGEGTFPAFSTDFASHEVGFSTNVGALNVTPAIALYKDGELFYVEELGSASAQEHAEALIFADNFFDASAPGLESNLFSVFDRSETVAISGEPGSDGFNLMTDIPETNGSVSASLSSFSVQWTAPTWRCADATYDPDAVDLLVSGFVEGRVSYEWRLLMPGDANFDLIEFELDPSYIDAWWPIDELEGLGAQVVFSSDETYDWPELHQLRDPFSATDKHPAWNGVRCTAGPWIASDGVTGT